MTYAKGAHAAAVEGELPDSYALHARMLFDGFTMSGPATVHAEQGRVVAVDRTRAGRRVL